MLKYYVAHDGKQLGPWSVEEIRSGLEKQSLTWADYLYDEGKADWIVIAQHPFFSDFFKQMKVGAPAQKKQAVGESQAEKQWFVLKGENKYGPFAYLELVRMLQEKNLYEYDYVWTKAMNGWSRVADCADFKSEKIKQLKDSNHPSLEEVFFRRRHARFSYGSSVLVHNNKKVWKGRSIELSPGGAGLYIESRDLEPGQTLFLHFKAGDDVPPFNAVCSIVSKQYASAGSTEVKYGVKFTNVSNEVKQAIKTITERVAA